MKRPNSFFTFFFFYFQQLMQLIWVLSLSFASLRGRSHSYLVHTHGKKYLVHTHGKKTAVEKVTTSSQFCIYYRYWAEQGKYLFKNRWQLKQVKSTIRATHGSPSPKVSQLIIICPLSWLNGLDHHMVPMDSNFDFD